MRSESALKNFITGLVPFLILLVLGFWKLNVWQRTMDESVYALNQLFFQIFAYLSLGEISIGTLAQKEYYRLLSEKNQDEIRIYYTLSRRMFRQMALLIAILGVGVSFFLPLLSKGSTLSSGYMKELFYLFLAKSLVGFVMFSPRYVLQADQKMYKINAQWMGYRIAEALLETLMIQAGFHLEHVMVLSFCLRIVMYWHLDMRIFREYPWLKPVKNTQGYRLQGFGHAMVNRLVATVYENTDIILISAFVNPFSVVVYSNYKYITKYLYDLVYNLESAVTSGLGSILYSDSKTDARMKYEMVSTLFCYIACWITVVLLACMNPFIRTWVGESKVFEPFCFLAIVFLSFHTLIMRPLNVLKEIFALYKEMQTIAIVETVINLGLSVALIIPFGMKGVLGATIIALFATNFWYFPVVLYRKVFDYTPWLHFFKYGFSLGVTAVLGLLTWWLYPSISSAGYAMWFLTTAVYAVLAAVVLGALFAWRFRSFRELGSRGKQLVRKVSQKGKSH